MRDGGAGRGADDVDVDRRAAAGVADHRQKRELVGEVAEDDGAPRLRREGRALAEGVDVDGIEEHRDLLRRDAFAQQEAVGASVVDGDVADDAREVRGRAAEVAPAVTDEKRGRGREVEQRGHRLQGTVAVNHIDRRGNCAQIVRHRDRQARQLARSLAKFGAVDDGRVAALEQPCGVIAFVGLHAADLAERVAGDQNAHARFSISAQSASRSGTRCSARRMTRAYRCAATRSSPKRS